MIYIIRINFSYFNKKISIDKDFSEQWLIEFNDEMKKHYR
jgi:hypothetical protein